MTALHAADLPWMQVLVDGAPIEVEILGRPEHPAILVLGDAADLRGRRGAGQP